MYANNIDINGKQSQNKGILPGNCIFPFKFKGEQHTECIEGKRGKWCATKVSKNNYTDKWGYCHDKKKSSKRSSSSHRLPIQQQILPKKSSSRSSSSHRLPIQQQILPKKSSKRSSSSHRLPIQQQILPKKSSRSNQSKKSSKSSNKPQNDVQLIRKLSRSLSSKSSYEGDNKGVKKLDTKYTIDPELFHLFKGNPQISRKWLLKLYDIYKKTGCILFRNITNWLPLEYYDGGVGIFSSDYTNLGIDRCLSELKDPKHKYIVFILVIRTKKGGFHANSMIMDINKKTVWRFEPNGSFCSFYSQKNLDRELDKYFKNFNYKYISPLTYQNREGPQYLESKAGFEEIEGQTDGFCAGWSLYFIHLFLENNIGKRSITVKQLDETLVKQDPIELAIDIRGYMGNVMRSIKHMKQIAPDGYGDDKHDLEE
jgi:hypothetical protein